MLRIRLNAMSISFLQSQPQSEKLAEAGGLVLHGWLGSWRGLGKATVPAGPWALGASTPGVDVEVGGNPASFLYTGLLLRLLLSLKQLWT